MYYHESTAGARHANVNHCCPSFVVMLILLSVNTNSD